MKFKDKLRLQRDKVGISQEKLAEIAGVTRGSIANYEQGASYPKNRDVYNKLADFFGVDVNYFLTEDEDEIFLAAAMERFGKEGLNKAEVLLKETAALFAGGDLSERDKLAFQREMQAIFLDSMERASLKKGKPKE